VLLPPVEEEEGRQRKYTAQGEDKATVEEDAWIFGSRRWQGWGNSGELQQQEVARMAVERWAAEHRNRGAPQ
jgi:hypothetical protein